jgi:hypothetical protein
MIVPQTIKLASTLSLTEADARCACTDDERAHIGDIAFSI